MKKFGVIKPISVGSTVAFCHRPDEWMKVTKVIRPKNPLRPYDTMVELEGFDGQFNITLLRYLEE